MQDYSKITIFVELNGNEMKYNELLRLARKQGWMLKRQAKGSHAIYEKNGIKVVIPQHGAKEMPKGLELKLRKKLGL